MPRDEVAQLLHPYVHFDDRGVVLLGRTKVIEHLTGHPTPKPPTEVAVRGGQVCLWRR